MKRTKLTKKEKQIENALIEGKYVDADKLEFEKIARAVSRRRRDSVLNIRVNSQDIEQIKQKAGKLGIKYQTFISELLHRIAQG